MASVAGIKAGHAYVVIGAIDDTGKMLAKIGRGIRRWGNSLSSMGMDLLFKGMMASLPVAGMLKWTADFDDSMKRVQARTGATDREMNSLSETARTVGRDIGLTAREIAAIMDTLSQREFGLGDIQRMTRPIAVLAKATGTGKEEDTANATRLMSQTLNAFNIDTKDSAKVADILAVAANKSNFALDDLREAMSKVGPMAHQMGMGLEETVAIMAQMRNVEIEAETAGIAMRNILLNASDAKATAQFNAGLEALGKSAVKFTDDAGNLRNESELLFEVFKSISDLGTAQRVDLLSKLFGKRAAVPAIVAAASQKSFEELMKAIQNSAGEAERISKDMEKGIGGAFRAIKTASESVALTIGATLDPLIQSLRRNVVELLGKLEDWVKVNPRVAGTIAVIVAGVGILGGSLIALGLTMKIVGVAVSGLGILLIGLKAAVVLAAAVMTTAFTVFSTVIMTVPAVVGFLATSLMGLASMIWSAISAFATFMATLMAGASLPATLVVLVNILILGALAFAAIGAVGGKVLGALYNAAVALGAAIADAGKQIWAWLGTVWERVKGAAINAFSVIGVGLGSAFQLAAVGKFQLAAETALKSLKVGWLEIRNVMLDVWDEVKSKALTVFNQIEAKINKLMLDVQAFFGRLGAAIAVQEGRLTPEQGKAAFEAINFAQNFGKRMIGEGIEVKPDQEAKKKRQADLDAARKEFQDQMKKIAPDLKDPLKIFDDLKDKLRGLGENPPMGQNVVQAPGTDLKALDALEKGTIEAAKAAYEASVAGEIGADDQKAIVNGINQVADNTAGILENLQVA